MKEAHSSASTGARKTASTPSSPSPSVIWLQTRAGGKIYILTLLQSHPLTINSRWFYWLLTIFACLGCVFAFFCLPETQYHRSPTNVSGQMYHTDEFGVTRVLTDEQAREYGISPNDASDTTSYAPKRSFLQTLNPVSPVSPNGFSLACNVILKMLSCLSSPAVVWAILASSISLGEKRILHSSKTESLTPTDRLRHRHVPNLRHGINRRLQLATGIRRSRQRKSYPFPSVPTEFRTAQKQISPFHVLPTETN